MKRKIWILFLIALLCGCETKQINMQPPDLALKPRYRRPIKPISAQDIREAFNIPVLKRDSKIAMIPIPQQDANGQPLLFDFTVDEAEGNAWRAAFQDGYYITDIIFASPSAAELRPTIDKLRLDAAKQSCNLLVVYGVTCDYARQANPMSVLYLTVIGGFFVPGDTITAKAIAKATMLNVETGDDYFTVEDTAVQSNVLPMFWVPGSLRQMYQNVSATALGGVRDKIAKQLDRMRDKAIQEEQSDQVPGMEVLE